jgi:septal ring factor EnvC (AmiA/AmiB activator)
MLSAVPVMAADKIAVKKKSLEEIRQQLEEKKKELEKYKAEELLINSQLDDLKKEDKLNVGRQKALESQLAAIRARSSDSKEKHDSLSKAYKDLQGDLSGEAAIYALDKIFYYPYYGRSDISRGLLLKYAILEKHNLINRIKGETVKVTGDIQNLSRQNLELKAKKELVEKQRSAQKSIVKSKMTELERSREKQARLSREVENLQNAALGLTRLVKKLEKQAPYRPGAGKSRELPIPRHSLPWPAQGKVISRYGREEVPLLKTWIVREGIRIRTAQAGVTVFPVMSGKVIYSGPFRTYGNVVIVDHEQGFFTIYGLLQNITVSRNDAVTPSSPLGRAGDDTQRLSSSDEDYSAVYFEIRVGAESIDPLLWLTN